MSSFGAKGLTNKGRVLQAKAQAGAQLKYTKYVLGDGQLGGQSIGTLINVISPKKTVEVSRLKMTPPNQAMVGFVLSNQDVNTGFYFRELGLYALDPDEGEILYWYANAGDTADYIPPTNTGDVVNKTIDMLVYVGTASNVTLTIDQNLAYVTHDELDEALADLDPDIPDASLTVKGKVQLSSATNSTSETMAATPKAVKAAYDRADAAFTSASDGKVKVRDAITGAKGTVTDADGDGFPTFDELTAGVQSIPSGFTADATAAAGDILTGKTAYKSGAKVTGIMPNQGAIILTPTDTDQIIPAGYHNGSGKVKGAQISKYGAVDLSYSATLTAAAGDSARTPYIVTLPVGVSTVMYWATAGQEACITNNSLSLTSLYLTSGSSVQIVSSYQDTSTYYLYSFMVDLKTGDVTITYTKGGSSYLNTRKKFAPSGAGPTIMFEMNSLASSGVQAAAVNLKGHLVYS